MLGTCKTSDRDCLGETPRRDMCASDAILRGFANVLLFVCLFAVVDAFATNPGLFSQRLVVSDTLQTRFGMRRIMSSLKPTMTASDGA